MKRQHNHTHAYTRTHTHTGTNTTQAYKHIRHSYTDRETYRSQTLALEYIRKCTHINTLTNRHVRN